MPRAVKAPRPYDRGMDESALTRRRLLQLAGIGFGASALTACEARTPPAPTSPAGPPSVEMSSGSFASKFRTGARTYWTVATPVVPGRSGTDYPVALFLHGLGGNNQEIFDVLEAQEVLQRHLAAGRTPFAIASVDGGDTWWHARADGSDTQSMLVNEFVPFLGGRGYDLGRIGLFGLAMGGFGSLLLASQARLPGVRAVAAMSPAAWNRYGAGIEGAFDSAADFAAHDVFALRPRLAATPKRIDCGTEDALFATVKDYVSALPNPIEGGFRPGGHDVAYWRSVLPDVASFLGRHLA